MISVISSFTVFYVLDLKVASASMCRRAGKFLSSSFALVGL